MEVFDNINRIAKSDLVATIKKGSRIDIAATCFSIYAYQELKAQLDDIDELRFIFTSPSFVTEKAPKEKREFYIPRLARERSLYGTEFEIKLRNELSQKAIARECADWIRKKVRFMSSTSNEDMNNFLNIITPSEQITYSPLKGFTTADIGSTRGNSMANLITRLEAPHSNTFVQTFDAIWRDKSKLQDVTDVVIESTTAAYRENSPDFLYFFTLYNIFSEFLDDISEDILPNEAIGFRESKVWSLLYDFQQDAVLAIISKLEQYNGCILADSVGLGKTFTALAVIKYFENRNRNVLVLCPKKLSDNWSTYRENYKNNPISTDRLRYDVLFHTDLLRRSGKSGGIDLAKLNWENYDLVVIDESHNFRNGGESHGDEDRDNRYDILLNRVIRAGIKTKVLMLSATPVNNRFADLRNQLALAYEGEPAQINEKLNTSKPIDEIFRNAQRAFNEWSQFAPEDRSTQGLLNSLDFDFFKVLDSVTIARSRKHIEKYYDIEKIGKFPERLKPITLRPNLTDLGNAINYKDIYEELGKLNLSVYTPMNFVFESKKDKYVDDSKNKGDALRVIGRERGLLRLMRINLLKRLESSVFSFRLTIERIIKVIEDTIANIEGYKNGKIEKIDVTELRENDFDTDDQNTDSFAYGKKRRIDIGDLDHVSWQKELIADAEILELLLLMVKDITPEHDTKLQELLKHIANKIENPINPGNKKILIFSAFADTVKYLYDHISKHVKKNFGLDTAMVSGSVDGKTTIPKLKSDLNTVLTCFSPLSKDKALLLPNDPATIDVLIGTDCISEGQNLQDCDYCINYDIHWNPVRIIQRFGRIDRIGSKNAVIQLVNFWPNVSLDEYINLKPRVETRMKAVIATSTGDDDLINPEEKGDLEYRKAQLERLQNEVVDIEEMQSGISIMDLGLNEFRLDLLDYVKANGHMDNIPFGLHALLKADSQMPGECPPGVVYVLKNKTSGININSRNRLHPFYMVYVTDDGQIYRDHLSPKELLDTLRLLCKGKDEPDKGLCKSFNAETEDGKKMGKYSRLLDNAIAGIIDVKGQSDMDSFLSGEVMSFLSNSVNGLDDFELICFFVITAQQMSGQ
ncbi:MAG: SNF2-related protein [Holophagaceae bacterium]|nr:SNF2-related protein [Holophagaceae bacterium]